MIEDQLRQLVSVWRNRYITGLPVEPGMRAGGEYIECAKMLEDILDKYPPRKGKYVKHD